MQQAFETTSRPDELLVLAYVRRGQFSCNSKLSRKSDLVVHGLGEDVGSASPESGHPFAGKFCRNKKW